MSLYSADSSSQGGRIGELEKVVKSLLQNPGVTITGDDGLRGAKGEQGVRGEQGIQGNDGEKGETGSSVVTPQDNISDSSATKVADLKSDFNKLLELLRDSGVITR